MGGRTATEHGLAELLDVAGLAVGAAGRTSRDPATIRVNAITADSRDVRAGGCFVAVPGESHDGHDFIDEAVRGGAAAVVTQRKTHVPPGVGNIQVRDARSALARLAAAFYGFGPGQSLAEMKLIGVTGTNGKTTTCHVLRSILGCAGHPTALLGTISYDLVGETCAAPWTTPPPTALYECLSRAARHGATHAVMEASSHALAQSRCDGHRFEVGVFTNLSGDHLDYHENTDAYAAAKKRLFDGLDRGAASVVNGDDPWSNRMIRDGRSRVMRFGFGPGADIGAVVDSVTIGGSRFTLCTPIGSAEVRLSLIGRHNIANALAASGAAIALGVRLDAVVRGLESVSTIRGRLERVATGDRGFSVFVDYAHTDDGLSTVLASVRSLTAGRLICVFGCGGDRDRTKRPRMAAAADRHADAVLVTSDNPRSEDPGAIIEDILTGFSADRRRAVRVEPDRRRAIERAVADARAGDTVLIAGKGHEDDQIVRDERWHFDDVEVAGDCLERGETMIDDAADA